MDKACANTVEAPSLAVTTRTEKQQQRRARPKQKPRRESAVAPRSASPLVMQMRNSLGERRDCG